MDAGGRRAADPRSQRQRGLQVIAKRHGRTLRAIEARLEKLGLIAAADRITRNGFERAPKN